MDKQGQQRIPYTWLGTYVTLKTVDPEDLLVGGTLEQADSDGVVITYPNSDQDGKPYKETGFYPWTSVHHLYTESELWNALRPEQPLCPAWARPHEGEREIPGK